MINIKISMLQYSNINAAVKNQCLGLRSIDSGCNLNRSVGSKNIEIETYFAMEIFKLPVNCQWGWRDQNMIRQFKFGVINQLPIRTWRSKHDSDFQFIKQLSVTMMRSKHDLEPSIVEITCQLLGRIFKIKTCFLSWNLKPRTISCQ